MAARYRKIDPRIWDDEKIMIMPTDQKLVVFHGITAQSNRCGLFVYSEARAVEQTGLTPDSYAIAFTEVCRYLSWGYQKSTRVLYIPTWWKYNPPENRKHLIGCLTDLHDLPTTPLLEKFRENLAYVPSWGKDLIATVLSDRFPIAMGIAMAYQNQKQEQDSPKPPSGAASEFHSDRKTETDQAERFSEIRSFATNWLSANHPNWLRKTGSLIEMLQALGRDAGIAAAQTAIAEAKGNDQIRDPFAYSLPAALKRANSGARSTSVAAAKPVRQAARKDN